MKKGLALSLSVLLLAAILTGCTGASAPSAEASPAPSPTPAVSTATPAPTPTATPQVTPTPQPQVYTAGVLTDSDYTNTCLGFRFAPQGSILMPGPDALGTLMEYIYGTVYGDAEVGQQLLEESQQRTTYEMIAADQNSGSNVSVVSEKLSDPTMDEAAYIETVLQQVEQAGIAMDRQDLVTTTLGDTQFTDLTYTMADGAGTQTLLVKKIGDTMCSVAFFYDSPEAYETLLGCFSTITAA